MHGIRKTTVAQVASLSRLAFDSLPGHRVPGFDLQKGNNGGDCSPISIAAAEKISDRTGDWAGGQVFVGYYPHKTALR